MKNAKKSDRQAQVSAKLEQAAKSIDKGTTPAREKAARLITQANAIKGGRPIPAHAEWLS